MGRFKEESPAYLRYPQIWENSETVMLMTLEQEGAYSKLLDHQWKNGSIPNDLTTLAKICKNVDRETMERIWVLVRLCFEPVPGFPTRLFNPVLEEIRASKQAKWKGNSEKASFAANTRWAKCPVVPEFKGTPPPGVTAEQLLAQLEAQATTDNKDVNAPSIESACLSNANDNGNGKYKREEEKPPTPLQKIGTETVPAVVDETSGTVDPPEEETKTKVMPKDEAFEVFVSLYDETKSPAKYPRKRKGDFVQLAGLRAAQDVPARASPPCWDVACRNYLLSPLGHPASLADLCKNYELFVKGQVDRYGRPITDLAENGEGNRREPPGSTSTRVTSRGDPIYIPKQ